MTSMPEIELGLPVAERSVEYLSVHVGRVLRLVFTPPMHYGRFPRSMTLYSS